MSVILVAVSVANSFVHSHTAEDSGYEAFGDLALFDYWNLQKLKKSSSLPLVEQWEEYDTRKNSWVPAIDDEDFLAGTRVVTAVNKVGGRYLKTEFRGDALRILNEFVNCLLSTVGSITVVGQVLSCLCPAIFGGGDVALCGFSSGCYMGFREKGGWEGSRWTLVGLSASTLWKGSDKSCRLRRKAALR